MNTDKIYSVLSIVLAAASAVIGFADHDGVVAVTSILALGFGILVLEYTPRYSHLSLIASVIVILCTIATSTIVSYDFLVGNGHMDSYPWSYISGIVYSIPVIPLIMLFYLVSAYMFKASYNWVIVGGFATFIGMGMMVPGYAMDYLISSSIDSGAITVSSTSVGLLMNALCFIAFALLAGHTFKKHRYILTERGIEVMS